MIRKYINNFFLASFVLSFVACETQGDDQDNSTTSSKQPEYGILSDKALVSEDQVVDMVTSFIEVEGGLITAVEFLQSNILSALNSQDVVCNTQYTGNNSGSYEDEEASGDYDLEVNYQLKDCTVFNLGRVLTIPKQVDFELNADTLYELEDLKGDTDGVFQGTVVNNTSIASLELEADYTQEGVHTFDVDQEQQQEVDTKIMFTDILASMPLSSLTSGASSADVVESITSDIKVIVQQDSYYSSYEGTFTHDIELNKTVLVINNQEYILDIFE